MIELFIEGQRVDIDSSFAALMTFSIDDVKDFSSRNTSFSKTIVLPGTKRNNYLFGSIFNYTSSSFYNSTQANFGYNFNAAISAKAYIFNDNIQVFKGILRLMQVNQIDEQIDYEVSVFGELGGLVAKIGNKKLEELDFSAYNHVYNATNIVNSWNTINGSSYYYPLIDYGTFSTAKQDWKIGTFRPALYAKEYLDKIFASAGYTYASTILNSTRFKNLIIPHNAKILSQSVSRLLTLGISSSTLLLKYLQTNATFKWNTNSGSLFTPDSLKRTFTYNGITPTTILITFNISGTYNLSTTDITLSLKKNGVIVPGTDFLLSSTAGLDSTYSYSIAATSISLVGGDYLEFIANGSTVLTVNEYLTSNGGSATADSVTPSIVPIVLGDTISINSTIPKNILQKDFFVWIIKLFNLYVYEDPFNEKVLKIDPYVDFFNVSTSIDWSLKIDRSKSIKVTPLSEMNSRYYEFSYKDDSDFYNDLYKKRYNLSYGSFKYDSKFEFATEVNKCEIGFSPTVLVGYVGQDKVYPTIFKSSNSVEESIDSNIRILQAKKVACAGWNILNSSSASIASPAYYGYAGHFDDPDAPSNDLNFGIPQELFFTLVSGSLTANQFNLYWSSYMAEITDKDSKLLTASFKLDFKDIYNLDFSKFIYLDGSLFRLNKITDFNATDKDICEVQLLKVIEKIY